MIQVGVAHEHRIEGALGLQVEATRQRARVDCQTVVDDESTGPMLRSLSTVASR